MLAYTGKVLNYILATPPSPDDASSSARARARQRGIRGRHPSVRPTIRVQGARQLRLDGGHDHHPPRLPRCRDGALGHRRRQHRGLRPRDREGVPAARFDGDGRLLNADEAVGEIVNTDVAAAVRGLLQERGSARREGARRHLLVRRSRVPRRRRLVLLRGPLERVAARRRRELRRRAGRTHRRAPPARPRRSPSTRYPTSASATSVMVADRGRRPRRLRRRGARRVPRAQPDLGTKWVPSFVRVAVELPKLASMKLDKTRLRREAWNAPAVWWRRGRGRASRQDHADGRRRVGAPAQVTGSSRRPRALTHRMVSCSTTSSRSYSR